MFKETMLTLLSLMTPRTKQKQYNKKHALQDVINI